jgi:predicted  nucleic acid-binding Zn-ribbon protein
LKKQILFLIKLQEIDSEITRLKIREKALPGEKESLEEELERFEETVKEEKKRLDDLNNTHGEKEKDLRIGIENAKKTKSRLLEVKTNKEYEATLKEIDAINTKNSSIEDEIISLLEEIDRVGKDLETREKELVEYRGKYEGDIKKVETELSSIASVLKDMVGKDRDIREKVDSDLIRKYDVLREKRNGQAVVPAWKEICSGCHMNIPPQLYNELQRYENVITCPNCNRVIYWKDRDSDD